MKNRTLIGIVCIVVAVVMVFGVTPLINKMSEQKTTVVRLSSNVSKGAALKASDLEEIKMTNNILPEKAMTSKEFLTTGTYYASVDMQKGDVLTLNKITSDANNVDTILSGLDGTQVAMSIKVDSFAAGLSGKLESGDIVSFCVTKDKKTTIPLAFKYVRVLTTTTSGGVDEDQVKKKDDGSFALPATITVLVSPRQAALLASYKNDFVHVVLVSRGDEEKAAKYLEKENEYLDALEEAAMESAKKMLSGNPSIVSSDAAFNAYYEAHRAEFLSMMNTIFENVFGMNFDTSDATIYEDAEATTEEEAG